MILVELGTRMDRQQTQSSSVGRSVIAAVAVLDLVNSFKWLMQVISTEAKMVKSTSMHMALALATGRST